MTEQVAHDRDAASFDETYGPIVEGILTEFTKDHAPNNAVGCAFYRKARWKLVVSQRDFPFDCDLDEQSLEICF